MGIISVTLSPLLPPSPPSPLSSPSLNTNRNALRAHSPDRGRISVRGAGPQAAERAPGGAAGLRSAGQRQPRRHQPLATPQLRWVLPGGPFFLPSPSASLIVSAGLGWVGFGTVRRGWVGLEKVGPGLVPRQLSVPLGVLLGFALLGNASLVATNLSLLLNSVGFYQVSL
ncbi:unnamed protein product [Closterium sp. NIES-53]